MSLSGALSIAESGLSNINAEFQLISQNVANASTPGYSVENGTQTSLVAGDTGLGVKTGPAMLQINQALETASIQQNATVSGLQTTQTALQAIDPVLGTPGSGTDIGSLLGNLQDSFSTLLTDPGSQAQQTAVVAAAQTLAQGVNALSTAYTTQRQAAQNDIGTAVTTLNTTLATIGQLNTQIVSLQAEGQSTADLQNQRNEAVQTLSGLLNVNTNVESSGAMQIFTSSGLTLPTSGGTPFTAPSGSVGAQAYYPGGGLSGITLNGQDVTSQMQGGEIGADIDLRDTILPTDQAELDEFAEGVSTRFASQGLTLFTDSSGNVPSSSGSPVQSGYVGYAATIQVNPAVTADPSLVRDGTNAVAAIEFTPNPSTGPAGFTTLIQNVLNYTFGSTTQSGSQPALNTTGLGPDGNLTAPFTGSDSTLAAFATNLVSAQAQQSATTTNNLTTEQAMRTSLNSQISSVSGVNMDTEMSQMLTLQSAYAANARVLAAVQSMFTALMSAVPSS